MAEVEFTIEGRLARVHLNRPDALNAITTGMDVALHHAWNRINDDPDIWVALLTAQGDRAFCAGADISAGLDDLSPHAFGGGLTGIGGPLLELRKPLVAAVQGHAVGGGFELAMCADLLIVSDTVQFKLPEVQAGLIGQSGVLHRAIRKLPLNVAMDLILTGRTMHSEEAHRLGLANAVVDASVLEAEALKICANLMKASPLAIQAAMQAMNESRETTLVKALGSSYPGIESFQCSEDRKEAMLALAERRSPRWQGK